MTKDPMTQQPKRKPKTLAITLSGLVLFIGLLVLGQIWFDMLRWDVFIKLIVSLGIALVLVILVTLIKREFSDSEDMRKDGYID